MNMKLDASVVLALVFGCFASSASAIDVVAPGVYTPEYTNAWFSVATSEMSDIQQGGNWVSVPGGSAVVDGKIELDTDISNPLTYMPAASTITNITRIVTTLTVTQSSELPALDSLNGAKTALCVCTNAAGVVAWFALVNNGWLELTNSTPVVESDYEIVLDSDSQACMIRFLAKRSVSNTEYVELTDGWVSNSRLGQNSHIERVSFAGSTMLGDFAGVDAAQGYAYNNVVYKSLDEAASAATAAASGDGDNIEIPVAGVDSVKSANISLDWIKDNVPSARGENVNWATVQTDLNGNGANNIARWQSYVLNLDPAIPESQPIVQPVQNVDKDKVAFALDVNADAGVPVSYVVKAYNVLGGEAKDTSVRTTAGGAPVEMALPSSGVRYYKMEDIQFGNNP